MSLLSITKYIDKNPLQVPLSSFTKLPVLVSVGVGNCLKVHHNSRIPFHFLTYSGATSAVAINRAIPEKCWTVKKTATGCTNMMREESDNIMLQSGLSFQHPIEIQTQIVIAHQIQVELCRETTRPVQQQSTYLNSHTWTKQQTIPAVARHN